VGDLLRHLWGITDADHPATIRAKVTDGLQAVGMDAEEAVSSLCAVVGLPDTAAHVAELSPQSIRSRTFATLHRLYRHLSQQRPVLLEVEDVHWIDPTSQDYLEELVDQVAGLPLLLLVTFRPGYRPPWMDKSYATQLALSPLSRADGQRVVQAVLGAEPVPAPLMQDILTRADGNPFFLEELARVVQEQGALHLPTQVPDTVQAVLAARLDRLPPDVRYMLQVAAVIGMDVPWALLQAVAAVPADVLQVSLTHLHRTEFLVAVRPVLDSTSTFKHALTREVAYGSLLQVQRRALHARIVEVLETLAGDRRDEYVDRLAHHAVQGQVWDKAVTYCQQAGARANGRATFREALAFFEQALQALAHLLEGGDTRGQAIAFRRTLGSLLSQLGEHGRGLALLGEAEALARALDDRVRLGGVLATMSTLLRRTGDSGGAIATGQQALALAVELGDSALQVQAAYRLGQVYETIGDFGRAAELLRQNVEAAHREAGTPSTDWLIRSQAWLARTLSVLGAFAEGRRHGEEALRLATLVGRGDLPTVTRHCLGHLYLAQGDLEQAIRVLEQGLVLCRASSDWTNWRGIATDLGSAYTLKGRLAEGRALLDEASSEAIRTGALQGQASRVACLSEVCRLAGHSAEAWQHARQALDLARQLKERGNEAHALYQLGVVHTHADPPDVAPAEAHYQQALALANELGMRPLLAHCHYGLGRLYHGTGRDEPARAALATAIDLYRTMDMTFYLQRAEAALAAIRPK